MESKEDSKLERSQQGTGGPVFGDGLIQIRPQSTLKVEWLRPSNRLLRRDMRPAAFESLKASIQGHGILEPLVVRLLQDHYEIICGHRRFEAARELGLLEVPVAVRDLDDRTAFIVSVHENLHRDDLSPVEEARAYQKMVDDGMVKSQKELAGLLGVSEGRVSQKLKLLVLPKEVQDLVSPGGKTVGNTDPERGLFLESGGLTERHARAIARLKTPEERVKLAQEVAAQQLTVEATERRVARELGEKGIQGGPKKSLAGWVELGMARYKASASKLLVEIRSGNPKEQGEGLRIVMRKVQGDA